MWVDHKNRNKLDNRRSNLRVATPRENASNRGPRAHTSRFKGVTWHRCGRWQVVCAGKYVGLFVDESSAAAAYDRAAHERYGSFAYLNFPKDNEP